MELTLSQIEDVHQAYKALPVKGDAFLSAAKNMVALRPHIEVKNESTKKVFETLVGPGANQCANTHPAYPEVVKELEAIASQKVTVTGLIKLEKKDLRINEETTVPGLQAFVAILLYHGLLTIE